MKKGITREFFQDEIQKAVLVAVNDEVKQKIVSNLKKRGYDTGLTTTVLANNHPLDTLSLIDLGVFAQEIYKHTNLPMINPSKFMEDAEMDIIKGYKREIKEVDISELLVFDNVLQISRDMWTTIVPIQRIADLYNNMAVSYDFRTQRQPRNISMKEGIIQTPDINRSSVEEIRDSLLEGSFIPNTITFNIPIENSSDIKFDKVNNRLIIKEKVLKVLDGFHRSLGIMAALQNNPDLKYNFIIVITNFTTDKAKQLIVQEDKRNPIAKSYLKSIDEANQYTAVINMLNEDSKSEIRGKITTDYSLVASGHSMVTFDFIYDIVEYLWDVTTFYEAERLSEYLRKYFNHLTSIFPINSKVNDEMYKEKMFLIYLVLAKILHDKDGGQYGNHITKEIIENIRELDSVVEYRLKSISDIKKNTKEYIEQVLKTIKGGEHCDKKS